MNQTFADNGHTTPDQLRNTYLRYIDAKRTTQESRKKMEYGHLSNAQTNYKTFEKKTLPQAPESNKQQEHTSKHRNNYKLVNFFDHPNNSNPNWSAYRWTYKRILIAIISNYPNQLTIATVCNNCDTSIQYVQEHYFHYDAKRATDALSTGCGQLKSETGTYWTRYACIND